MGFLKNVLNKIKPTSNLISLDDSLGNVLLAGNSFEGKNVVIRNVMLNYYQNSGCFIIKNSANGFSAMPNMTNSYSMVYGIDTGDGSFTEQFNPFANLNDRQTSDLLFNILNKYAQFDARLKMKYKEYISKMVFFIKLSGQTVKMNELYKYSLENLEDLNNRSHLPDSEKMKNERFFDGVRADIGELESYFSDFENNNIGFILSGTQALEDIINTRKIIEVNLDFTSKKDESETFLSILTDCICRIDFGKTNISSLAIAVDEIPNEILMDAGCEKFLVSFDNCHVVYSILDIATLSEKTNVFTDKADSIFFFQQNSNKNKEYCSEFFGTYEKQKVSMTQSEGKNRSSAWDYFNGRGQSSRSTQVSQTVSTEKERIYLPDVFGNLPKNECIYFFRNDGRHGRLKLY